MGVVPSLAKKPIHWEEVATHSPDPSYYFWMAYMSVDDVWTP